jgi:hypothetical protein
MVFVSGGSLFGDFHGGTDFTSPPTASVHGDPERYGRNRSVGRIQRYSLRQWPSEPAYIPRVGFRLRDAERNSGTRLNSAAVGGFAVLGVVSKTPTPFTFPELFRTGYGVLIARLL